MESTLVAEDLNIYRAGFQWEPALVIFAVLADGFRSQGYRTRGKQVYS